MNHPAATGGGAASRRGPVSTAPARQALVGGGSWRPLLAFALWLLSAGLLLSAALIDWKALQGFFGLGLVPHALAFSTVGAILAGRRPDNAIGWLFAAWGLVTALTIFASAYLAHGLAFPGSLPGPAWGGWVVAVLWHPAFALLAFMLLLFPDGHLPGRRWRGLAWLTAAVYAALALSAAFSPSAVHLYFPEAPPALVTPFAPLADATFDALLGWQLGLLAAALVSLVLRLHRARGAQRQQLKWFVYTIAVVVVAFVAGVFVLGAGYLFPIFVAIPVAAGVAVLRYRLYDIDRIVSRTVAYGLLTALLVVVYVAGVGGVGLLAPLAGDSDLAVAGSTLAVAALFGPARRRVQALVDRHFNRERYDAARTVGSFRSGLHDEVDLKQISDEILAVAGHTMQPARVALWLRPPERSP